MSGRDFVGGLVGYNVFGTISQSYATGAVSGSASVGGLVGENYGTISQSYATGTVSGRNLVGGLIGYSFYGTISQSYATGAVSGKSSDVGGLVGSNSGTISQSYATGTVSGRDFVGGLAGSNSGTISQSYATGAVSGRDLVGGLVGVNGDGDIRQSYATGAVSGNDYVGGLVGINGSTISESYATGAVSGSDVVGGLVGYNYGLVVGYNYYGTISQSYATGTVSGSGYYVGGLVGYNEYGTISQSYWDVQTTGQNSGVYGGSGTFQATGLTSAQARTQASYVGWDFATVWGINPSLNNGYPYLLWQAVTAPPPPPSGGSSGGSTGGTTGGTSGGASGGSTAGGYPWSSSSTTTSSAGTNQSGYYYQPTNNTQQGSYNQPTTPVIILPSVFGPMAGSTPPLPASVNAPSQDPSLFDKLAARLARLPDNLIADPNVQEGWKELAIIYGSAAVGGGVAGPAGAVIAGETASLEVSVANAYFALQEIGEGGMQNSPKLLLTIANTGVTAGNFFLGFGSALKLVGGIIGAGIYTFFVE